MNRAAVDPSESDTRRVGDSIGVSELRRYITDEIFIALGFQANGWQQKLLWPVFWLPAHKFARLAAGVDQTVNNSGIRQAAQDLLPRLVNKVGVWGAHHVPLKGPLLVASNHPGAYDVVAILANLPRSDLKIIVSGVPFLRGLPAVKRHMIYIVEDAHVRMNALRASIRHLRSGGALLIFPSGRVDPDPKVLPGASEAFGNWSMSIELILRKVPQTQVIITIVSGVLAPSCLRNPITRLPKERWRQQKLAEFLQVMQQMILPRSFGLTPNITFGKPLTIEELRAGGEGTGNLQSIIERGRLLLANHMESVYDRSP